MSAAEPNLYHNQLPSTNKMVKTITKIKILTIELKKIRSLLAIYFAAYYSVISTV